MTWAGVPRHKLSAPGTGRGRSGWKDGDSSALVSTPTPPRALAILDVRLRLAFGKSASSHVMQVHALLGKLLSVILEQGSPRRLYKLLLNGQRQVAMQGAGIGVARSCRFLIPLMLLW